jgi:hypothetical protein
MAVPVPSISCCVLNHHNLFYQILNAPAFNRDMCCHLALCLGLLPFHLIMTLFIIVNSCNVCAFYCKISSNKLDLFQVTCFIVKHIFFCSLSLKCTSLEGFSPKCKIISLNVTLAWQLSGFQWEFLQGSSVADFAQLASGKGSLSCVSVPFSDKWEPF